VYCMTRRGRQQLAASVTDWQRVVAAVGHCLQGGSHARPGLV
jgi:hypothetical protein